MQRSRSTAPAADGPTPAELIARITAEQAADEGSSGTGSTGRHGAVAGAVAVLPARTRRRAADEASTGRHGTPDGTTEPAAEPRSGRHGAPAADEAVHTTGRHGAAASAQAVTGRRRRAGRQAPTAVAPPSTTTPSVDSMTAPSLPARAAGGRRRRRADSRATELDAGTVVTRDVEGTGRSLGRRMAPLAVGVVVVVLATLIATLVRPDPGTEPELSSALVQEPPAQIAPDEGSGATVPPPVSDAPESVGPVTPGDGALVVDGVTWTPAGGDEFTDGLGPDWTVYDQDGRSPDSVSVADGVLTLRGDAAGRTGGVAWTEGSRFGRWEMRARFPAGDPRYHPVLLLWPTDVEWPGGGEIDFAETASGSGVAQFFLHHGADNSQLYAERTLDTTQWHDYAVEWTENRVTGYVDGQKWFESTDPNTLPPGNMQAVVQLDWFPQDNPATGPAAPTEMQVDHVRLYT